MDARLILAVAAGCLFSPGGPLCGASFRSTNFVVEAPSEEIAGRVAAVAERSRDEIALDWLGHKLKPWYRPCRIRVKVGRLGAGGATTFNFDRGRDGKMHVFGWRMTVQGTLERILDSVVPHEVSHTIFATHFRRPLPRWADEGAATLVEHESERRRQQALLNQVFRSGDGIPLRRLLSMDQYPSDMRRVLTLYAQGYSLADYLVQRGGKARFLEFLADAHQRGWDAAIRDHYGLHSVENLEQTWNGWVLAGSPRLDVPEGSQLADASSPASPATGRTPPPSEAFVVADSSARTNLRSVPGEKSPTSNAGRVGHATVIRGQSPDDDDPSRREPAGVRGERSEVRGQRSAGSGQTAAGSQGATDSGQRTTDNLNRHSSLVDRHSEGNAVPTAGRRRALNEGWIPVRRDARGERTVSSGQFADRSAFPQPRTETDPQPSGSVANPSFSP